MAEKNTDLGRLEAVYGIAPAYLQRAAFIAVLSFMFFMGMMFTFYVRQHVLYFFLSSAFLIVYLITMFSWIMQRKGVVEVHEKGLKHKKKRLQWTDIEDLSETGDISYQNGKKLTLPSGINDRERLISLIRRKIG